MGPFCSGRMNKMTNIQISENLLRSFEFFFLPFYSSFFSRYTLFDIFFLFLVPSISFIMLFGSFHEIHKDLMLIFFLFFSFLPLMIDKKKSFRWRLVCIVSFPFKGKVFWVSTFHVSLQIVRILKKEDHNHRRKTCLQMKGLFLSFLRTTIADQWKEPWDSSDCLMRRWKEC